MNTIKKWGVFFSSSVNDAKLAATVEGAIAAVGSFLVFMGFFDIATETTLLVHVNQLITDITILTPLVISMGSLCYAIFGLLRKAVVAGLSAKGTTPILIPQDPTNPVV